MAGANLVRVQEYMGHSTIGMTMRYAHLAPENGRADIDLLVTPAAVAPATAEADPKLVKIA
jgi:integrase